MGFEIVIIMGYFVTLLVPVATVVVFFVMEGNAGGVSRLPVLDTYELPAEALPMELIEAEELDGSVDPLDLRAPVVGGKQQLHHP